MNNKKFFMVVVILVLITSTVSFVAAAAVFFGWGGFAPRYEISFDPSKVSSENIKKFNEVRDILNKEYYKDTDQNKMVEGAIAGMTSALGDPYTTYFTKEQMKSFEETTGGSYVGIGVSMSTDEKGNLIVVDVFDDSPAKNVGVLPGDRIAKVDNVDVTGMDENIVISKIKGKENTKVKITVYRETLKKYLDFDIVRKKVKTINVSSEVLDGNIGYIKISMFDEEIYDYFEKNLEQLLKKGIKSLIIDVRDNPGGDYYQVVKIADRLLPKCTIVYTEDKQKKKEVQYSDAKDLEMPIAVLVNGNSASASEILSGALKDNKKAKLIGTKTFGKGLVQVVIPLDDGSGLKVTVARYFTPSGVCIQGQGIEPDFKVENASKYDEYPVSQIPRSDDLQLKKAIDVLSGGK